MVLTSGLESLAFRTYYGTILARGIVHTIHQNAQANKLKNAITDAKDMAETSLEYLSKWENLTQAFNLLMGETFSNRKLPSLKEYFKSEFWIPTIRKIIIRFINGPSDALGKLFLNLVTIYSMTMLLKSVSTMHAIFTFLGLLTSVGLNSDEFNAKILSKDSGLYTTLSTMLALFQEFYHSCTTYMSKLFSPTKVYQQKQLEIHQKNISELSSTLSDSLSTFISYDLSKQYINFSNYFVPMLGSLVSQVVKQTVFLIVPLVALGSAQNQQNFITKVAKL